MPWRKRSPSGAMFDTAATNLPKATDAKANGHAGESSPAWPLCVYK
jgi:hypothetical protein